MFFVFCCFLSVCIFVILVYKVCVLFFGLCFYVFVLCVFFFCVELILSDYL